MNPRIKSRIRSIGRILRILASETGNTYTLLEDLVRQAEILRRMYQGLPANVPVFPSNVLRMSHGSWVDWQTWVGRYERMKRRLDAGKPLYPPYVHKRKRKPKAG